MITDRFAQPFPTTCRKKWILDLEVSVKKKGANTDITGFAAKDNQIS